MGHELERSATHTCSAQVRYTGGCMKGLGPYDQWCVADPNNVLFVGGGGFWYLTDVTRTPLLKGAGIADL